MVTKKNFEVPLEKIQCPWNFFRKFQPPGTKFWRAGSHPEGGLHDILHLQVTSWGNVLDMIPPRIHTGFQIAPHLLHPQLVGSGASVFLNKDFPQICLL